MDTEARRKYQRQRYHTTREAALGYLAHAHASELVKLANDPSLRDTLEAEFTKYILANFKFKTKR